MLTHDQARALLEGLTINLAIHHFEMTRDLYRPEGRLVADVDERYVRGIVDQILGRWSRQLFEDISFGEGNRDTIASRVFNHLMKP